MTTTKAQEVAIRTTPEARTFAQAMADGIACEQAARSRIQWPSEYYRTRPIEFAHDILGIEQLWEGQLRMIDLYTRSWRIAIRSGHKVSKSYTIAIIALHFYCCYDEARVVLTSATSRQVDAILWHEIRRMYQRSGVCSACLISGYAGPRPCPHSAIITGDMHELARSGLKSDDYREIVGFTAREAEAVAGISGKNLLYCIDEASGVGEDIFEAIEGNRAGGARIMLTSNPTRTEGEHYEAFASKAEFYDTLTISSEDTPNAQTGQDVIPGLATREWIEEKKREWGVDSSLYRVRVLGQHVLAEEGKIFSLHTIAEAEVRWADTCAEGRLYIGLDPAGPGDEGDETAAAVRRGSKILLIEAVRGLDEVSIIAWTVALIREYVQYREIPILVVDREGQVGARVYGALRSYLDQHPDAFELVGVRSSERPVGPDGDVYDRVRDALYGNFASWIREGGAIPEDARLAKELHAPEWRSAIETHNRLKATPKREIKKSLGRSPDRGDACLLCVWTVAVSVPPPESPPPEPGRARGGALDPYSGGRGRERAFDPYAGRGGRG